MKPSHRTPFRHGAALVLAAGLALGLGACGRSSDATAGGSSVAQQDSRSAVEGAPAASAAAAGADRADAQLAAQPLLVRRADAALVVKDINVAAGEIRAIASTAGGAVTNESIEASSGESERSTYATLTIQVPADKLDETLTRLEKLGDMASRHTSSDDVTSAYVDTEARVASMKASVDRMRTLMSQATAIADIVSIESELSRRQADLEGLEAQMRSLKDQVAMSPIELRLTTNRIDLGSDGGGFLGGLKAGWAAFIASVNFLLMAAGALLPFAVAAAVVLVPLVLWLRRRSRRSPQPPAGPTAPAMVPARPTPTTPMASASAHATAAEKDSD